MGRFLQALTTLLPTGFAWPRDPTSVWARVLRGVAGAFSALHDDIAEAVRQWQPHHAVARLAEWEQAAGLPDACFGPDQPLPLRRKLLLARLRGPELKYEDSSPASPGAIVGICAWLGYEFAEVKYNTPFRCGRRVGGRLGALDGRLYVNVPLNSERFRVGVSRVGARLLEGDLNGGELACYLQRVVHARYSVNVLFTDALDPDAIAWAAAVTANGGTYSIATLRAVSDFCKAAKDAGYWVKLNRVNLFCGDQLAAAQVPLKAGGGAPIDANMNFLPGDYSEGAGLTSDGVAKHLRTGLIPSVSLTLNDTHLAFYNRSASPVGGAGYAIFAESGGMGLYAPFIDGVAYSDQYTADFGRVAGPVASPAGLVVGSRVSAVDHRVYRHDAVVGTGITTQGALLASEIVVFGAGAGGVAYTSGGYSIGAGLTPAEVPAYAAHMEAFQEALGRGVQP